MRVRETPTARLQEHGVASLTSAELLAVVTGAEFRACDDVLLSMDGSLRKLSQTPVAALTAHKEIGFGRAAQIAASLELGKRLCREELADGAPVRGPRDVYALMQLKMQDLPVEEFHVLVLDSQHRVEKDVTVTRGLLNTSLVHPREVFREAIAFNAAALVLVHNHPSGDPTPSPDDRVTTEQLVSAGRVMDIPVQDHIIIGRGRYISFAEAGLL